MARRPPKGLVEAAIWEATYTPPPNTYYIQVDRECLHGNITDSIKDKQWIITYSFRNRNK